MSVLTTMRLDCRICGGTLEIPCAMEGVTDHADGTVTLTIESTGEADEVIAAHAAGHDSDTGPDCG